MTHENGARFRQVAAGVGIGFCSHFFDADADREVWRSSGILGMAGNQMREVASKTLGDCEERASCTLSINIFVTLIHLCHQSDWA